MNKSFLLEIGTEEMPARFIDPALDQLKNHAGNILNNMRIKYEKVEALGTPRRLAVLVTGLAPAQESLVQEVKGPAAKVAFNASGEPSRAALGFAKSQGVDISALVVKPVGPVDYVFALKKEEGRPTGEILPGIGPELINGLHFPKPMRWGSLEVRFARPVRWLLALYGSGVVEFEYAGLKSGNVTYGHRFLSSGPITLDKPEDYIEAMKSSYVLVNPRERREVILEQVRGVAAAEGGHVEDDEDLLAEVTNLVEWPTALCGKFDENYLALPKEVLVTPMREHQRYFPVVGPGGGLLNKFIAVRNGTADYLDTVRAGNEKVLRARLADAAFFWEEDLKTPLARRVEALQKVVWQESLGTVYDKVLRIRELSRYLAEAAGEKDTGILQRAAYLAKADLVTNMVYEFPELQGTMGREYALRNGEEPEVARAIFEHYLPRFAGDRLPETLPGRALSLADKLDTLVGCFGIGIQPTGSQDPYALRRQALGICHIILDGRLVLSLKEMVARAYGGYLDQSSAAGLKTSPSGAAADRQTEGPLQVGLEQVQKDLEEFFVQRLKGLLADRGFAYDTVEAVLAPGIDDLYGAVQKVEALAGFRDDPAFGALLTAFNRANNLAKKHEGAAINPSLFNTMAEQELFKALEGVSHRAGVLLENRDYSGVLKEIGTLRGPVDNFFEGVMVMVEDQRVRDNRLALLKKVASLASPVADLSKIVVAGA